MQTAKKGVSKGTFRRNLLSAGMTDSKVNSVHVVSRSTDLQALYRVGQ